LRLHYDWLNDHRDPDGDGLISIIHPDESGLDDSPKYDGVFGWMRHYLPGYFWLVERSRRLGYDSRAIIERYDEHVEDVMVNVFYALSLRALARLLGDHGEVYERRAERAEQALLEHCWDERRGLFWDLAGRAHRPIEVSTWSSLAPLALPSLPEEIGRRLVDEQLLDPARYRAPYGIPSVSREEPSFRPGWHFFRCWRGPSWVNTAWLLLPPMRKLGYEAEANRILESCLAVVERHGFREYYNPLNGEGLAARHFGWSTLLVDLAAEQAAAKPRHGDRYVRGMSDGRRPPSPRADRVLPGVWRLRLPLPWPGVPHGNAWAVTANDGIVLFDTGIGGEGTARLEQALAQAGFGLADVRLVACTHAHADHYGLAGPIIEASGCELWIHPAWEHVRAMVEDPEAALEQRIEVARQSGVPPAALREYEQRRRGQNPGIDALVPPDRELLPGVEVKTDLGSWQVHETPGHAPSHVCFHQPERGLLISGDHLLGRISIFYDYGHTPDPVGEFLAGLDEIAPLDAELCLSGHGRPFRDVAAKIAATRAEAEAQLARVRRSLADGPKPAFETVPDLVGTEDLDPATAAWGLQIALAYLDHLALAREATRTEDGDSVRWALN
jgi:glyoxylase-like metal-dependent hydrolase (beta-lactamase superfamily II)